MATVPTASALGLGQTQTTPDKTPLPNSNSALAAAPARQRASDLAAVGTALQGAAESLTAAHVTVRSRADTIDRARIRKGLNDKLFSEFNKFKTEGNAADPAALKAHKERISGLFRQAQEEHSATGSADSQARLAVALEEMEIVHSRTVNEFADVQQLAVLNEQLDGQVDPLIKTVRDDPTKLTENIMKAEAILDEYAPALTPEQEIERADSIRQLLVMGAVESFTDVGAYDEAKKLIDENPTFLEQLNSAQQKKILNTINQGMRQRRLAIDKVNAEIAAMETVLKRKLTASEREGVVLGKIKAPLSEAGKVAHDRREIEEEFGSDSEEVKEFDRLHRAIKPPAASKLGKLLNEKQALDEAGVPPDDPRQVATQREIDGEDPGYKLRQEKVKLLPKVRGQIKSMEMQTNTLRNVIAKTMSVMLGREMTPEDLTEENLTNLKNNIAGQSFDATATGAIGKILTFSPFSTDAAIVDSNLATIKGINIVNTISEMRQNSPTGGAMGALSDREGAYLAASKGPLDIRNPEGMLDTLINMYIESGHALESRKAFFQEDFGELLKNPNRSDAKPQSPAARTNDGTPIYDVTLDGKTTGAPSTTGEGTGGPPAEEDLSQIPIEEMNLGQIARALNLPGLTEEQIAAIEARFSVLQGGNENVGN